MTSARKFLSEKSVVGYIGTIVKLEDALRAVEIAEENTEKLILKVHKIHKVPAVNVAVRGVIKDNVRQETAKEIFEELDKVNEPDVYDDFVIPSITIYNKIKEKFLSGIERKKGGS